MPMEIIFLILYLQRHWEYAKHIHTHAVTCVSKHRVVFYIHIFSCTLQPYTLSTALPNPSGGSPRSIYTNEDENEINLFYSIEKYLRAFAMITTKFLLLFQ